MTLEFDFWPSLTFAVVMLSWVAFVIAFFTRKRPPSPPDTKRDPKWIIGIVFQGLSYAIVWIIHRQPFTPIVPMASWLEIMVTVITIIVAVISVWLVNAAIRTLGQQWSLAARLVQGHKLVTEGPYGIVRNPIYTGMLGMLLATGLAISHWLGLLIALVIYMVGSVIRIQSEEKLLRGAFGAQFEAYARKVPALIPLVF